MKTKDLRTVATAAGRSACSGPELPRLGAHLSIAGGLENAIYAGAALGCTTVQIFVRNQRQWAARPLTEEQIARFRTAVMATGIAPVTAHASYLLNLASPDAAVRNRSIVAMIDELTRCEALGVAGLIVHPGAYLDGTLPQGIRRIARCLDKVHRACRGFGAATVPEFTAGQGTSIGWRFEQLGAILDSVADAHRMGVCLDTCHLFAAGHDFRTAEGYQAMIDELAGAIGLSLVKCIHTNDSRTGCGSRVDRHEHIGKGRIGKAGFAHFLNDARFRDVPFILETPKGRDGRGTDLDEVNLKRLRALVGKANTE